MPGAAPREDICLLFCGDVHKAPVRSAREPHYERASREVPVVRIKEYHVASKSAPLDRIVAHRMSQAQDVCNVIQRHRYLFFSGREVCGSVCRLGRLSRLRLSVCRLCRLYLGLCLHLVAVLRQHLQRDRVFRDVLHAVHNALHNTQLGFPEPRGQPMRWMPSQMVMLWG